MTGRINLCLTAFAVVAALACPASWADERKTTETARLIVKKHAPSIVWVSAVVQMRIQGMGAMMGPRQEQKVRVAGTVVDAAGLTVVSQSRLDPFGARSMSFPMGGDQMKIEIKTEVSSVKIRAPDGKEVPARLVLQDEDLGLAFVQPDKDAAKAKGVKWQPLKPAKAPAARMLDPVICLYRLGKQLAYKPAVGLGRLAAVVDKPRPFLVPGGEAVGHLGMPAFNSDGKLLGILTSLRAGADSDAGLAFSDLLSTMTGAAAVIVPAEDVEQLAEQARKVKPPRPRSATAKEATSRKATEGGASDDAF